MIAAFASLLTPFLLPGERSRPGFIIAIGGVLVASVAQIALAFSEVALSLDASRRWVTLTGVHEHFAQAVNATSDRELRGWPG